MTFLIFLAVVALIVYSAQKTPKPPAIAPNGCYIYADLFAINLPGVYQCEIHYPSREDGRSQSTNHYRFDGVQMYSRCIEDKTIGYKGQIKWRIRDGVVLDEWIKATLGLGMDFEFIERMKASVEWSLEKNDVLRFFAMSKHPDRFNRGEIREMAYGKINTIKTETQKAIQYAQSIGFLVKERSEGEDYYVGEILFESSEDWSAEKRKEARQRLEDFLNSLAVSQGEIYSSKEITDCLSNFIEEHLLPAKG